MKITKVNRLKAYGRDEKWPGDDPGMRTSLESVAQYERLKAGEIDWTDHQKNLIKTIEIPIELFYALMERDKLCDWLEKYLKENQENK